MQSVALHIVAFVVFKRLPRGWFLFDKRWRYDGARGSWRMWIIEKPQLFDMLFVEYIDFLNCVY